jgi:hypothetical protein
MTSGCRISIERSSMSFRKPYLEYSCSPVVHFRVGSARLSWEADIIQHGNSWVRRRSVVAYQLVSVKVVWVKDFLPPVDVNLLIDAGL